VRRAVEHEVARAGQEPRRVPPTRPRAASPRAAARPTHPQPPTRGSHRAPGPAGPQTTRRHRHPTGAARAVTWPRRPRSPFFFCSPVAPSLCVKGAAAGRKPRVFLTRPASSALPAGRRIRRPRRRRLAPSRRGARCASRFPGALPFCLGWSLEFGL